MLIFVTSMRHPQNATDYAFNEKLLGQTLESISAQASDAYHVFVVGNEAPAFPLGDKVTFVPVGFDPPRAVHGPHADRSGFVLDKGSKIGIGLIAARDLDPDWVMIFDADDFVHRSLTGFVHEHPDAPGWVIRSGWIYSEARNGYRRQDGFNGTCGTSYVLPYSAYDVPKYLTPASSQQEVADAFGDTLTSVLGAHRNAVQWFAERGLFLLDLPFRAAVYHVDTGENHSGKELRGIVRPWNRTFAGDFNISPSRPRVMTFWQCVGPVALAQSLVSLVHRVMRRLRRLLPGRR